MLTLDAPKKDPKKSPPEKDGKPPAKSGKPSAKEDKKNSKEKTPKETMDEIVAGLGEVRDNPKYNGERDNGDKSFFEEPSVMKYMLPVFNKAQTAAKKVFDGSNGITPDRAQLDQFHNYIDEFRRGLRQFQTFEVSKELKDSAEEILTAFNGFKTAANIKPELREVPKSLTLYLFDEGSTPALEKELKGKWKNAPEGDISLDSPKEVAEYIERVINRAQIVANNRGASPVTNNVPPATASLNKLLDEMRTLAQSMVDSDGKFIPEKVAKFKEKMGDAKTPKSAIEEAKSLPDAFSNKLPKERTKTIQDELESMKRILDNIKEFKVSALVDPNQFPTLAMHTEDAKPVLADVLREGGQRYAVAEANLVQVPAGGKRSGGEHSV